MSVNPYATPQHADDRPKKKWPGVWLTVLTVFGVVVLLACLVLPSMHRDVRGTARRSQCSNNLQQIGIALHEYEATYHALPPAYTVDANGKPLHSWRTLILPYLGGQELYDAIDLSKPWDDPANADARNRSVVLIYRCPEDVCPQHHTTYLASVAPGGCFRLTESRCFSEITDGLSQTLMIVEAPSDRSVHWMSPNDADETLVMSIRPESKLPHASGTQMALCDGSVRFFETDLPAAEWRALISIAGNDKVPEGY